MNCARQVPQPWERRQGKAAEGPAEGRFSVLRAVHGPSPPGDQDSTEEPSELCEDGAWAGAGMPEGDRDPWK